MCWKPMNLKLLDLLWQMLTFKEMTFHRLSAEVESPKQIKS